MKAHLSEHTPPKYYVFISRKNHIAFAFSSLFHQPIKSSKGEIDLNPFPGYSTIKLFPIIGRNKVENAIKNKSCDVRAKKMLPKIFDVSIYPK